MLEFRDKYEHHLVLKMSDGGIEEAQKYLKEVWAVEDDCDFFECTPDEGKKAYLHRFAAAGAAIRYETIHRNEVEDIVALDIALRRNDEEWLETLPEEVSKIWFSRSITGTSCVTSSIRITSSKKVQIPN